MSSSLNARQREAVQYIDTPCLVLAGAGSGKTSVITRKVAYLIEECGLRASQIAALTFTNKAAREMKERVSALVRGNASRGLTVSTFHNLGLNIIRRERVVLGFRSGFSIYDSEDSRALLKELMLQQNDLDSDLLDQVLQQISTWKNQLYTPAEAYQGAGSQGEQRIALLYERYNSALQTYNAVDFDDLILLPARLFLDNPEILKQWQHRIRYLLVDEYQDTNGSQYQLVKLLVGGRSGLTVVGDDDQSIYAWRGANPENLAQLQRDYANLKVIKLEQNYRSTSRILKCANQLIANNPHVFEKSLWSNMGVGEPLKVIRCGNEEAEAERVANEIFIQRQSRRARFGDFAILYRGNHQSRAFELKLQQLQIPYTISGGNSFFSRSEIKDVMAYLRVLINPDDDNALLRIINTPRRQLGPSTLKVVSEHAGKLNTSLLAACADVSLSGLAGKNLQRLRSFSEWLESVRLNTRTGDPVAAIREMLDDMDYEGWLHQTSTTPRAAERRFENVLYLMDCLAGSLQKEESAEDDTALESAIRTLILRDLLERQSEQQEEPDQVQMMTLHSAKGLEFPYVFMVGMEEELLPHRNSIAEDSIEEERRLAYVGITRAQQVLHLTLSARRKQFGEVWETTPSRFLDELPEVDLEIEGFSESDAEVNRARGRDTLDSLLDSL